jgi:4-amino-4-deoxy-L-arabinose transferase-like glycosyltransferase
MIVDKLGVSRTMVVLITIALLYPVVLCAVFFPTPFADLREQIHWGMNFPLYTWKHPPLQSWVAGIVASTGVRDAWLYAIVGQLINVFGAYYLFRAAREFLGSEAAPMVVLLVAGGIFFVAAVPTYLINADQVLFGIWAAILYYALAALLSNRWRDWLLLGVFAGLALLDKYDSLALLAALVIATLSLAELRRSFLSPKLYVAVVICAAIVTPTVILTMQHPETLNYASGFAGSSWPRRLRSLSILAGSLLLYLSPIVIVLATLSFHRQGVVWIAPTSVAARFILVTTAAVVLLTAALILGAGFIYSERYSYPIFAVLVLAVTGAVHADAGAYRQGSRTAVAVWVCVLVGSVIYAIVFINKPLREPAPAAAAILRGKWEQTFSCGPAYIIGIKGYAVALYYGGGVLGVGREDLDFGIWVDRDRLKRLGAIVIGEPDMASAKAFQRELQHRTPTGTISLHYRRTWQSDLHTYEFYFVPPQGC